MGRYGAYTPKKTRDYETLVAAMARESVKRPFEGPLKVSVHVYLAVPKSFPKAMRAAALAGDVHPTSRPDLDNYLKIALDAMNGIVYKDDSQVVLLSGRKSYSEEPRLAVEIVTW